MRKRAGRWPARRERPEGVRAARTAQRKRSAISLALVLGWTASGLVTASCRPRPDPPDIVLVSIDSLRADRLGCYGAERDTSPAIDAMAAAGARFETVVAPTSWTLPSHVTLLTGLPIPSHRVNQVARRIDPARRLLAEHLAELGYRTAAFVSAPLLHRAYGFDRGFEIYENFQSAKQVQIPPTHDVNLRAHGDQTAAQVVDAALSWLADDLQTGAPRFLFVHLWDVHYDYLPPPPYDRMFDPEYDGTLDVHHFEDNEAISVDMADRDLHYLRALYDGEIRWLDSQLGRLLDAVAVRAQERPTLVTLVADHGEEFFEHGEKGHYRALYEESVRVPWLLRFDGVIPAGTTVSGLAGLDDVAPTLLGLAGLSPLAEATGRDLSQSVRSGEPVDQLQILTLREQASLRGPGWKVILNARTGHAVYYDLVADPEERHPAPARRAAPKRLAALRAELRRAAAHGDALSWEGGGGVTLDAATRERLRELGYLEVSDSD